MTEIRPTPSAMKNATDFRRPVPIMQPFYVARAAPRLQRRQRANLGRFPFGNRAIHSCHGNAASNPKHPERLDQQP
jgi:hypothetical protein